MTSTWFNRHRMALLSLALIMLALSSALWWQWGRNIFVAGLGSLMC